MKGETQTEQIQAAKTAQAALKTQAALMVQAAIRRTQHDNPKPKGWKKGKASGASALTPTQLEAQRRAADSRRRRDALVAAHKHALGRARELKGALASGSSPPATTGWIGVAPTGSAERELLLSIRRPRLAGWTTRNDELTARPAGTLSSLRFESTLFPEDRPQTNCFKGEHHIRAITLTFVDAPPVRFETPRECRSATTRRK